MTRARSFALPRLLALLALASLAGSSVACSSGAEETAATDPTKVPTGADGGTIVGTGCTSDDQCAGLKCTAGKCYAASASDGSKDADETDVDCGGNVAPKCADGKGCGKAEDCASSVCTGGVCVAASPTDGVKNADETDVDCGGATAPKCADTKACLVATDCGSGVCKDKACAAPTHDDGVANGDETDVDCGGADAARCAADKKCLDGPDCDSRFCTNNVCEPRKAGRKDGDETDVDCGGAVAAKCDWTKACLVDADCTSGACSASKVCLEGPSCKAANGGVTCGEGEVGDPGAQHESCCRSLPVNGFSDSRQPGKKVYVDKYEITAGRMRAFFDWLVATRGGPDVKGYMAANRPARWVNGWENTLPSANVGVLASFTTQNPTVDLLYPGQDKYLITSTQSTWSVANGNWQIDPGYYYAMGGTHFFPEYVTGPGWPAPDYAASHNLNCGNSAQGYGFGTYWYPDNIVKDFSGGVKKFFSQEVMDRRALNCTPFGLYAAMCAWDGGQLVTSEVMDYIGGAGQTRFKVNGSAPTCANGIISGGDGSTACYALYWDPGTDYDDSGRVAPPGRIPADGVVLAQGDEPWRDMKGNLVETVLKPDNTFDYRSYGIGHASIIHHRNQISTPRMKAGSFGARCMRFR